MISSLKGILGAISENGVVIDINGVGFFVRMPRSSITSLGNIGNQVKIYTLMAIRDDEISLYGFISPQERKLFEELTSVSGFGYRTALNALSAIEPNRLARAIARGDAETLRQIPGVGPKMANRLILELRDKLAVEKFSIDDSDENVLDALVALGYSPAEASRALANIPQNSTLSVEEKIKKALSYFAK